MATFHFRITDLDSTWRDDQGYDFPDFPSALTEAKRLLAEMALDGIPNTSGKSLKVEVLNADQVSIATVTLEMKIRFPG